MMLIRYQFIIKILTLLIIHINIFVLLDVQVYLPVNIKSLHWALGIIELRRKIIYVYDCDISTYKDKKIKTRMEPYVRVTLYLLKEIGVGEVYQPWPIKRIVKGVPGQTNR